MMTRISVETEIDLDDIDNEDLIKHLEEYGYKVIMQSQVEAEENINNSIYELYRDYLTWEDCWMSSDVFAHKLKKFFEDQLGILVN